MARQHPLERYRNIGIIAHIDAGKTTTTERILFYTGKTHRIGSVDDGTTVTDWMEQERERGITIVPRLSPLSGRVTRSTSSTPPGTSTLPPKCSARLRVLDGGVVVFDAVQGVEPQSETVWRQADRYGVPRICFVNKMDRVGASFERSVEIDPRAPGRQPVPVQMPIGQRSRFQGRCRSVTQKAILWEDDLGNEPVEAEIPDDLREQAACMREQMVEQIAETDDELTLKYLEGEEISVEELKAGSAQGGDRGQATPVFCGQLSAEQRRAAGAGCV